MVEYSNLGSKFVVLIIATQLLVSLRYKLRTFGVIIEGPAYFFFGNLTMTNTVSLPQSVPKKTHNAICYHRVHESKAAYIIRVGWIQGEYNQADLGAEITLSTKRRYEFLNDIM